MELWARWTSECQKISILLFRDGNYEVRIGEETVRTGALYQPVADQLMEDLIRQKYFCHQIKDTQLQRREL
jgi:hypothetical protein